MRVSGRDGFSGSAELQLGTFPNLAELELGTPGDAAA